MAGLDELLAKRLGQVSARRAPVDEVVRAEAPYRERYRGWNVERFYSFYRREHGGEEHPTARRAGIEGPGPRQAPPPPRARAGLIEARPTDEGAAAH